MRIAFFADLLYYRIAAGSTRYAGELVRHLGGVPGQDLRLFSLYGPELIERAARERGYPSARSLRSPLPRPLQILLWHTVGAPGLSQEVLDGADVVHTPVLLVPPRQDRPLVVSVLDLSFLLFPAYHNRWSRTVAHLGLRRAAQEADALIAISEHTARDLIRHTGVSGDRVHVIPLAAHERFSPMQDDAVLARYGIDAPYLLYVGTLEPRKNLPALLQAFAGIEQGETKLVLAGTQGWMYGGIYDMVERLGLTSRVIFTGFVPDEDLPALLSAARIFVYPSLYEGFGLPVLEAMSCGAPVITTDASSLPEVAGDAALLVRPDDVEGLRGAIRRLLAEPDLRDELRGRGFAQAARFCWRETARQTAEVYEKVVSGSR
ncbi:glycosyltransferase family 1 protein [soil metagenome]